MELGADRLATGHYARIEEGPEGLELHRAVDPDKDQSYVLGVLTQDQLRHSLFPLADTPKAQVREEAARLGLSVAKKPDSHDICFIPDGDTQGFLGRYQGEQEGQIVDAQGVRLGIHHGSHNYTVGQRRGLGLTVPAADGSPRYVLRIEPVDNTVVVGSREDLAVSVLRGTDPTWTQTRPVGAWRGHAQFRAHGTPGPATISMEGGDLVVTFDEPVSGIAPGQTVVVFDGTRVVGSATIDRAS